MPDHAHSADPAVQAQLDRLWALSPGADVLGLERITTLLDRLGNPQRAIPPAFHVAGTNGKGSTCAFLRAMLEAAGHRVHVYSSPHLVRFNERIRISGHLIEDTELAPLLAEVLDHAEDLGASFFEVTTAAAFLAFARVPADACVIEVGLGGRLDATNVIHPVACGIASLGIDHEAFLLAPEAGVPQLPLARIGFEKAGIARAGVPLITQSYPAPVAEAVRAVATARGAPVYARDSAWWAETGDILSFSDAGGMLSLPLPTLAGGHQADNAALAVAMLRRQDVVPVDTMALSAGIGAAHWPARLQRLRNGPLVRAAGQTVWLDGGHNPDAGERIAAFFGDRGAPLHLVIGMLANKDPEAIIAPLAAALGRDLRSVRTVPVPGHAHHGGKILATIADRFGIAARPATDLRDALRDADATVLIAGSLYLAGEALALNDEPPE